MMVPDGSVLAKALTTTSARFMAESPDTQFRTQLLRSSLRIDSQPSQADVARYQQHLQAELGIADSREAGGPNSFGEGKEPWGFHDVFFYQCREYEPGVCEQWAYRERERTLQVFLPCWRLPQSFKVPV